jgi:hypothetical protein
MDEGCEIEEWGLYLGHPKRVQASIVVPRRKLLLRILGVAGGPVTINNVTGIFPPLNVKTDKDST